MKQQLERIMLNEQSAFFNRMQGEGVNYYHWHQYLEILYISSGYGIVVVDNQHYTVRPGRLFIFPPFRLHKVQVEKEDNNIYSRTTIHVDQSSVQNALRDFPRHQALFNELCDADTPAQIHDLRDHISTMETILTQFTQLDSFPHCPVYEIAFLMMQLIAFLPPRPLPVLAREQTISTRIMHLIDTRYNEKLSLESIATEMRLSRGYISRIFRQQTGGNLQEYLQSRRIKRGCELLRSTTLSIEHIARQVGFQESTYFITLFKHWMQQTPLQYRKQYIEQQKYPSYPVKQPSYIIR